MAINPASRKQQAASRNSEPASCLLPPAHYSRGFALLISVIFMSVMLSFGLALGSLGYKQQVLASSAVESQYAFYAADAALECALYADQRDNLFEYSSHSAEIPPSSFLCDGVPSTQVVGSYSFTGSQLTVKYRVALDRDAQHPGGTHCADVTVYKPAPGTGLTYLFSQGYDVPCTTVASPNGARFVARGLKAHY
ncbi:MAG: hypothetical protein PHD04_00990 [Candidatus Pacebacteria bacterium]|nr:hypothetical protein [Candidatus Paceibacterota bacterium]